MNRFTNSQRPGFVLMLVMIVIVGVSIVATGAITMGMNGTLIRNYHQHHDALTHAADAALETVRAQLNGQPSLFPDTGYAAVEVDTPVLNAAGRVIGLRSTYLGPVGVTSGEYGVYGTIISVVRSGPNTVIRRTLVVQESFSKFAYFTDVEPAAIAFGGGDQIFGPAHSNDRIRIYDSGATFHGPITTARDIQGRQYGTYREGYAEEAGTIPLPELADLQKLQVQGAQGSTSFTGSLGSPPGRATTRIEFVAVDLDGNGDTRGHNEGFIRVYQSSDAAWVVGAAPVDELRTSNNCGHVHNNDGKFYTAAMHGTVPGVNDDVMAALSSSSRRCYLGGAPELTNGYTANDGRGVWLDWPGSVSPLLASRADRAQLFPITRTLNPDFKGVVFVAGDVAVSGVVRGRVTVAATGNIIIADDITYATDPSVGTCEDILGLFAGGNIVVANTPVNAPWRRRPQTGQSYFSYDDTTDEFIHAFVLTLNEFGVQDYNQGSTTAEKCQTQNWGRGCLYLTGGIIQRQRGAVGTTAGHGYIKRYSYDACGATAPPPYFPTTGRFGRAAHYDVDPVGFAIDAYFRMLTAGN
jgi:hypothetical protein